MADHGAGPLNGTLYVTPVEAFDTLTVEPSLYSGTPTLDSANNRISVPLKGATTFTISATGYLTATLDLRNADFMWSEGSVTLEPDPNYAPSAPATPYPEIPASEIDNVYDTDGNTYLLRDKELWDLINNYR